jgi:hypothetical protein
VEETICGGSHGEHDAGTSESAKPSQPASRSHAQNCGAAAAPLRNNSQSTSGTHYNDCTLRTGTHAQGDGVAKLPPTMLSNE